MPRYGRYLRLEKNIAASDTGGILERWRYGRRLLSDGKATTPAGNLRHGVLASLVADATAEGYKLSEQEIQRRLKCARTYATEAEIRELTHGFQNWDEAARAGFPQVEVPGDAEPFDPRDADEKRRDAENERKRRQAENPRQAVLFDWDPPVKFHGDEHGPRTTVKELEAACDRSEEWTARMAVIDGERRSYVDELAAAVGGDTDKTWYEAEQRRRGLEAVGLTDWASFEEIMQEFFDLYDSPASAPDDDGEDKDGE